LTKRVFEIVGCDIDFLITIHLQPHTHTFLSEWKMYELLREGFFCLAFIFISPYKFEHLVKYENYSSGACLTESSRQYNVSNGSYVHCLFHFETRPVINIYLSNFLSPEDKSGLGITD
jgi:hypothetical protein